MSRPVLSVILPSFNAGRVVEESVATLARDLRQADIPAEIVVIDDGSRSEAVQHVAAPQGTEVRIGVLDANRGKGAAIKEGLRMARAPYVIFTDVDLPYGTEAIVRCFRGLQEGHLIVIGDRSMAQSRLAVRIPLLRRWLSDAFIFLTGVLGLNREIRDTQCGLKGFAAPMVDLVLTTSRIDRFSFDLELIVVARENGIAISRIPVVLEQPTGLSLRLLRESGQAMFDLLRIYWHRRRGAYHVALQDGSRPGTLPYDRA